MGTLGNVSPSARFWLVTASLALATMGCGDSGDSSGSDTAGETTAGTTQSGVGGGTTGVLTTSGGTTGDGTTGGLTTAGGTTGGETTGPATTGGGTTEAGTTAGGTTGGGTTGSDPTDDGNNSFAEAVELTVDTPVDSTLNPTGDGDYYKFTGTAGQAVAVFLVAQQTAFDPNTIDTVLTLYDASQTQIAFNDDPFPRNTNDSSIYTILPADGTYYVRVEECWTWVVGTPYSCATPTDKLQVTYGISLTVLDPTEASTVLDAEGGNTAETATALTYQAQASGSYYLTLIYGTFTDAADVDVFSVTVPADSAVAQGRSVGYFDVYPHGVEGNGSTSPLGDFWLVAADDPLTVLAKSNGSMGEMASGLAPPMDFGKEYFLFLAHPGGAAGSNDFYFLNHSHGGSNPVEADDIANNDFATAEALVGANDETGWHFFIEGDISTDDDQDHFTVAIPADLAAGTTLTVACGAMGSGSGLRGFTVEGLDASGAPVAGMSVTESATTEPNLLDKAIPAGDNVGLRISTKDPQATDVTGTFYRCGIHLVAP
jgi:hypothetical protein